MCEKGFVNLPKIDLPTMYFACGYCNKEYKCFLFHYSDTIHFRMVEMDDNHFIVHKDDINQLVKELNGEIK